MDQKRASYLKLVGVALEEVFRLFGLFGDTFGTYV